MADPSVVERASFAPPEIVPRTPAEEVVARLEEAGRTLFALPGSNASSREPVRVVLPDALQTILASGWTDLPIRPAPPSARAVSRMDVALSWISLIPDDKYVLRRIVGARLLINPTTDRHLFSWRRIGLTVGASHVSVRTWHAQGIEIIVRELRRQGRK
jgi:hypothetical protein